MEKRVLIVDFNHMAHIYMNSTFRLSEHIMDRLTGEMVLTDTTVQSGSIKAISRWSKKGFFPTVVCFDSPVPARKAYFAKAFNMPVDTLSEYKGGRTRMSDMMYNAIASTMGYLESGGVTCVKGDGYEADDLVFASIQKAKEMYPGMPIDVITNDADLIPLVDRTVSVWLRSKKGTYAVDKDLEKAHYIQITPDNYEEVAEGLSRYSKFYIPYNTVLLHKLLRGDPSDNIPGVQKLFPPKKYNAMVEQMQHDWVDIREAFRYGVCEKCYWDLLEDREETDLNLVRAHKEKYTIRYKDPKELDYIVDLLGRYIDNEDVLTHVRKMYIGMNLNQVYETSTGYRKPARIKTISSYDISRLQQAVSEAKIQLMTKSEGY